MACTVEVKDIFKEVKNDLLDLDGVKPTPSGVFFSYTQKYPDRITTELRDHIFDVRQAYQIDKHGEILQLSKEDNGVRIDITPTERLATAMTAQNDVDENGRTDSQRAGVEYSEDYLFNSRHEVPQGNNYMEFIRYKQLRLTDIQNEVTRLNTTLKNNTLNSNTDVLEVNKRIKRLENEMSTISRQLESLKQEEPKYMFHALEEDLANLEKTLESANIVDVNKVNNRLDFLDEFISGKSKEFKGEPLSEYNNPAFDSVVGRLKELQDKAFKKILETSRNSIENSSLVEELIENNEDLNTDDLFQAQKDINWLEKWTLGVTADRTNNTVIPQALYRLLRSTLTKKQSTTEKWNKQLQKLIEENPELKNPDFIKEKDSEGRETGFITDLFSPAYYEDMVKYKKALTNYIEDSSQENYNKVLSELIQNNNIIDFSRIRAVKDVYENTYPEYFKSTEEDMDSYEESLKKGLGPKYDEVVSQILNRLALFEEKKVDAQTQSGPYVERDLASQNIWKFNELVKAGSSGSKVQYNHEGVTYGVLFKDFNNVTFLPKATRSREIMTNAGPQFNTEATGYYNEAFKDIAADPVKLEYWKLIKNMSEYISSTYDQQTFGRLSYPKVQKEYAERLQENFKDKNFGKLFSSTAKEYKSWFYERGRHKQDDNTVVSNYTDSFSSSVNRLAKTYIAQGVSKDNAYVQAREEVLETYSGDFNSNIVAVAMEAALHDARMEVQPMAEAYLKYFKSIDPDRKKAIAKLEHFYEKIILNANEKYRDSGKAEGRGLSEGTWLNRLLALLQKVPYIKKVISEKSTYLLSDTEKKVFEQLKQLKDVGATSADYRFEDLDGVSYIQKEGKTYEALGEEIREITNEDFQEKFREHIQQQINDLGLDLNLAGAISGILKTVIFKGLGLNPISGIFNRIEGKHSSMIMDATGEYWTTGNIDVANNLMNFANITRLSRGRLSPVMAKRKETLQMFDTLVKQFNILQDRKNELQRSAEESKFNRELINPYMFAVENPEYKNQGSIIMAVLMDKMVTDVDGNIVPFLDKESGQFTIYDYVDGKLELKEEFRTEENIEAYEEFKGDSAENLVSKMTDAVSRSQGNYDSLDIMMVKKSIWGRAGTLFMTWFAEHVNQRFGVSGDKNYNLNTGKKRRDGRFVEAFKANKVNTTIAAVTGLTVSYGIGGPVLALAGVGGLGLYVYKRFIGTIAGPKEIKREAQYGLELVEFVKSLLVESLNYPGRILNLGAKARIDNNSFEKTNMSKEEIAAMRALTRELSIVLSWLAVKMAMGALLYDDEDDKESPQRMKHNFVQNQLSRTINALTVYTNPQELISDHSRIAALEVVSTAGKVILAIFNDKQREDLGKNLLDLSPIPRILTKDTLPWHNKMNYDEMSNFSGIPTPMKWTSDFFKDVDSDGEKSAEKEYKDIMRDLREEYKADLMSKHKGKKAPLKKEIDKLIKEKIGGYKKKDQTYQEKLEQLEQLGITK